jgi:uncharacterized protein (DUF2235 family)
MVIASRSPEEPRNIVIYSDGTGQRGGLMFDERRSNIYKLFRATRCGPDSSVNPGVQLTFYDPGLGTLPPGHEIGGVVTVACRAVYNLVSQATGLGITRNIIDCYAAIIRMWRPGDRIFLLGFSRGAYTVRCLSAVLGFCGIPRHDKGSKPLCRDEKTSKRIASEAVKTVYEHTESLQVITNERDKELLTQRSILADRFREKYGSGDVTDKRKANAYPYFVGVFDTVASLANPVIATSFFLFGIVIACGIVWLAIRSRLSIYFVVVGAIFLLWALVRITKNQTRSELRLPRKHKWRLFHFVAVHPERYETHLNPNVLHARHAMAIDERRKAFERVLWGGAYSKPQEESHSFEQLWFAGNHSDVGGSYPENESRLSDISLRWMLDAAVEAGLKYDPSVLKLYPDPIGPQHDETRSSLFCFFPKVLRQVPIDAPLHPSVVERFEAAEILDYDVMKQYRPPNLRYHNEVKQFYSADEPT